MKPLLNFEEFIKLGIVVKISPDKPRANYLIKESERKYKSLNQILSKIGVNELNSHEIIEYCYDILIYLLRSKLYKIGFSAHGEGAHEAEVSYMRNLKFSENDVLFMNQLRYFRNGIKYYGTILNQEYTNKVLSFLNKNYSILFTK
jgi:hypothetical protein